MELISWLLFWSFSQEKSVLTREFMEANSSSTPRSISAYPPILFVHGNGDSSALWITTLWRFESNGYPRERLFTIDFLNPKARDDDSKPEINRSSTLQQREELAARVDQILAKTGATKLALVGNSRG